MIKCPVCGKQMKIGMLDPDDSMGTVWMSIMPCDCVCSYGASKAVWQELDRWKQSAEDHQNWLRLAEKRLERTRKALDVAVDMLTRIAVSPETMMEPEKVVPQLADLALKQITALEQKE